MKLFDILIAVLVPTIFGAGVVFAKAALEHFPPILLMALRFGCTSALLVWFFRPPWHLMSKIFWISLVSATIQYSLTYTGLRDIDASLMVVVVQLEAPFAVILAWFVFGERLGWRRGCGMLLAIIGVFIIAGAPEERSALGPVLMVVAGAFMFSIGQIMVKKLGDVGGFLLIAWVATLASPQLFLVSWLFEDGQIEAVRTAGPVVWIAVIYTGVVMTALGYGLWYRLLGRYEVNQVFPFMLLVPVSAIIGGVVFLGEPLTVTRIIGAIVVIAGVAFVVIEKKPDGRTAVPKMQDPLPVLQLSRETHLASAPVVTIGIGLVLLIGSIATLLAA